MGEHSELIRKWKPVVMQFGENPKGNHTAPVLSLAWLMYATFLLTSEESVLKLIIQSRIMLSKNVI